jgi:AcrR family transcriptional regulator
VYVDPVSSPVGKKAVKPGRPALLNREAVLATALAMIDRGPLESFSMRQLADELGVGTMTLYGYVSSREELLAAVTAIAFQEVHRESPPATAWDERLRAAVTELHDICVAHPNLATLVLAQSNPNPGLFRLRERILATLHSAGFDQPASLHVLGALCSYAVGFATAQAATAPIDLPERIRALEPSEFPQLSAAADRYATHLSDQAFEAGLELLLAGLRDRRAD